MLGDHVPVSRGPYALGMYFSLWYIITLISSLAASRCVYRVPAGAIASLTRTCQDGLKQSLPWQ